MQQKLKWKLFWKEASVLIAHTLLAGFYLRGAQLLNDYYRVPSLAALFFVISLGFAIPLMISMADLWAQVISSVREEAIAEKVMKCSITIHKTFFGVHNAYMSAKQAILAGIYVDMGRLDDAEFLFAEAWKNFSMSAIKLPVLHPGFSSYLKILSDKGASDAAKSLQAELQWARRLSVSRAIASTLLTAPIIVFMIVNQTTEQNIAKHNAHGQILLALKEIQMLAKNEATFLGEFAAARVYCDYAQAFEDTDGQLAEMDWCVEKALATLDRSNTRDDYLRVLLLNLKVKAVLADNKISEDKRFEEAEKLVEEAVKISINWDKRQLKRGNYDAGFERDKALLTLAEIKRNKGDYKEAEPLYQKLLSLSNDGKLDSEHALPFQDPMSTIDRIHKLQHIEQKLGKKKESIELQKRVCNILETSVKGLTSKNKSSSLCDFGVREASRELDVCAFMLQEAGRESEAHDYHERADQLRKSHQKSLKLNSDLQDSIVDASTSLTRDLLSVKYHAGDWPKSLNHLLNDELKSERARGALERLPWYGTLNAKAKAKANSKRLELDIQPLSIRNNREGDGISVDVQGTVKIYQCNSEKKADEHKFDFAYVLKAPKSGRPSIEDLLDNQVLAQFKLY